MSKTAEEHLNDNGFQKSQFHPLEWENLIAAMQAYASQPEKGPQKCKCNADETHGWTEVKCCNECGHPVEDFWVSTTPVPASEGEKKEGV